MAFSCLRENLKQIITLAQRIISKNSSLPVLNNLLFAISKNALKISSTNLEVGFFGEIPCRSQESKEFSFTLPAERISNLLSVINSEKIDFIINNKYLEILGFGFDAKMQIGSTDDFPIIPQVKSKNEYTIHSSIFDGFLESFIKFTAAFGARAELSGILVKKKHNKISFVATDSFRLAEKIVVLDGIKAKEIKSSADDHNSFIMPKKISEELMYASRLFPEGEALVLFDDGQISVRMKDFIWVSKLIEGDFPDYQKIIPSSFDADLFLEKEEVLQILKLNSVFAGKLNDVRLKIVDKEVEFFSADSSVGENRYTIKIPSLKSNKNIEVNFNIRYLIEGFQLFDDKNIVFRVNSHLPALISSEKDNTLQYVVMPMKI